MRAMGAMRLSRLRRRARRATGCEQGAAILEFALTLPIMLILVAGAFELGRILTVRHAMVVAVGGGARYLSRVPDPSCSVRCSPGAQAAAERVREQILASARLPAGAVRVSSEWEPRGAVVTLTAVVTLDADWLRLFGLARLRRIEVSHREPWIAG